MSIEYVRREPAVVVHPKPGVAAMVYGLRFADPVMRLSAIFGSWRLSHVQVQIQIPMREQLAAYNGQFTFLHCHCSAQ